MCEQTPLKISVFSGIQNRNTIPDGAKRTETTRTDYEDARWSLNLGNNSWSILNSNFLTSSRWIHCTISQRNFFGNVASPMQSEWQAENLQTQFTLHWRCSIAENFTLCEIVAWFRHQFVSNLEFKVFVALFSISRLQRASPQSVRAVTVRFVLSGIVLRPVLCYLTILLFIDCHFHSKVAIYLILHFYEQQIHCFSSHFHPMIRQPFDAQCTMLTWGSVRKNRVIGVK